MFDIALVCARCQPPTRAHFAALAEARTLARQVAVLVLNADDAPSPANPFDNATRSALLTAGLGDDIPMLMLRDRRYEAGRWATAAEATVRAALGAGSVVVLADADVASTSLPLPVSWQRAPGETQFAAAEQMAREALFTPPAPDWARLAAIVPARVLDALREVARGAVFIRMLEEAHFLADYRQGWRAAPYPPVFVTVDSVATWRDRVLLIERWQVPRRGQ